MKKRDYTSLLSRLQTVGPTQLVAECGGYPIYALELGSGTEAHLRTLDVVLQRRLGE